MNIHIYIYKRIITVDVDHKPTSNTIYGPPSCDLCAQGRDYIYIYLGSSKYREPATFPFPLMSTASLRVVGHECHTPLQHNEVLHLYRWHTRTHTHTPCNSGADEMTMKVRWQWKLDEIYLTRTRRGEHKRRGKEQTPIRHTWPRAGRPWKSKERKNGGRRKRNQTSGGGGRRKRLNQPTIAKPKLT